eukprot:2624293-Rhodomonas_salina.2
MSGTRCAMAGTECARGWQANFLKPLNPILGETLQTEYSDGSKLYMEQLESPCVHERLRACVSTAQSSEPRSSSRPDVAILLMRRGGCRGHEPRACSHSITHCHAASGLAGCRASAQNTPNPETNNVSSTRRFWEPESVSDVCVRGQTCHHPPISSYHLVGPGGMYQYYGHTTFDIGFGYNRCGHLPRDRQTHRQTHRHTDAQIQQAGTKTDATNRHTDTQTHRHTDPICTRQTAQTPSPPSSLLFLSALRTAPHISPLPLPLAALFPCSCKNPLLLFARGAVCSISGNAFYFGR